MKNVVNALRAMYYDDGYSGLESNVLSKKAKYGLKALVYLADNRGRAVQCTEIAEAQNLPKKFLDAILLEIKGLGIISSKKGKGGGYSLLRPSDTISLGQVIRALDGPFAPVPCVSRTAYARCDDCVDEGGCIVRPVMQEVRDAISTVLDNRSLHDMMAMRKSASVHDFYDI